ARAPRSDSAPHFLPPQCGCLRARIPAGLRGGEREAARVPALFPRGCSPLSPRLPRLPVFTERSSECLPGLSRFPSSLSRLIADLCGPDRERRVGWPELHALRGHPFLLPDAEAS
ncbi:hypothetical protein H1C71_033388, partial [Ictidomys tridecemlineatus]